METTTPTYPIVPYKRNDLLLTMRMRVEEALKDLDDTSTDNMSSVASLVSNGSRAVEAVSSADGHNRASSGLSMIVDNYNDCDEECVDDIS